MIGFEKWRKLLVIVQRLYCRMSGILLRSSPREKVAKRGTFSLKKWALEEKLDQKNCPFICKYTSV